jgi:DNA-binding NarL/FixJ family response regulator
MSSVGVLLVDDFECWRCFVSSTLKRNPGLQVIGEVSDGLRAVRKAQELQPDLIVLDIGLPRLNGIEAARQIRKVAPNSKILFLTENHSPDIAAKALSMGATGYVIKTNAGNELLAAVEAVLQGGEFVSSRLTSREFTHTSDVQRSLLPVDAD